jgi:predicted metal-dependent hydrolase
MKKRGFMATISRAKYLKYREIARILAHQKIAEYNVHYNFPIKRVAVRNQSSRWGSCSKNGNLNFNYRIALLPQHLADYIVVHELCHLGEFNHSDKFWMLVEKTMPNWKALRKELKGIRHFV